MNRYKFTTEGLQKAAKFLKGKTKTGPAWAKKYKDDLKVVGGRVEYKGLPIIADTKVDDYLRDEMFKKDGTLPFGRDAAHHQLKKRVVGVTRRHLMRFIKAQSVFEQTKAAVPKAKKRAGPKLKAYTFETDLIFIRKNDLVNSNPRFEKSQDKKETYIVSTVEKSTGLCRLDFVKSKISAVVTPVVLHHIRKMAKDLGANLKECVYRSDAGTEFNLAKIRAVIPDAETVRLGPSVEKKNSDAQRVFYRILKSRRSVSIPDAIHQTQILLNSTFNRIQGGTPNELVEGGTKFWNLKTYNRSRAEHIAGDRRRPFEVGQRVRIQIKKEKGGDIAYKSYKGKTFSKKVYIVRKVQNSTPAKYWVNRQWLLAEKLLATEAEDEKSQAMFDRRDQRQEEVDKREEEVKASAGRAEAARKREAEEKAKREIEESRQLQLDKERRAEENRRAALAKRRPRRGVPVRGVAPETARVRRSVPRKPRMKRRVVRRV